MRIRGRCWLHWRLGRARYRRHYGRHCAVERARERCIRHHDEEGLRHGPGPQSWRSFPAAVTSRAFIHRSRPSSVTARSASRAHSAGSFSRHGCSNTISPLAARTISTVASAGSTGDVVAVDRSSLSGEGQGGRTSHASARACDDADLAWKPARHLSGPPRLQRRASPPPRRPPGRCSLGPR